MKPRFTYGRAGTYPGRPWCCSGCGKSLDPEEAVVRLHTGILVTRFCSLCVITIHNAERTRMNMRGTCVHCSEPIHVGVVVCPKCGSTDEPWTDFEEMQKTATEASDAMERAQLALAEVFALGERLGYETLSRSVQNTAGALDIIVRDFNATVEKELKK